MRTKETKAIVEYLFNIFLLYPKLKQTTIKHTYTILCVTRFLFVNIRSQVSFYWARDRDQEMSARPRDLLIDLSQTPLRDPSLYRTSD